MKPAALEKSFIEFFGNDYIVPAAKELRVNPTTVYRWLAKGATVPGPVIAWVRERKKQQQAKSGVVV